MTKTPFEAASASCSGCALASRPDSGHRLKRRVKPPLAEARGFHAQPLGHSDPRGASPYQGCGWQARRDCACARPQGIAPALAVCERALDSVWTARASLRNSLALALRSGDRGSPRDIFRAARYALDSRTKSRRCNPSPSTALPILRPASRMTAQARSSPGPVFNGNSRMKLAVCLRGIAQETTRRLARLQAACGKSPFRAMRSEPPG
jgi:hypothetical protein